MIAGLAKLLAALHRLLIEPAASVPLDHRQRVRLTSYMILMIVLSLSVFGWHAPPVVHPRIQRLLIYLCVAFSLNRTRYYRIGSYVLLISIAAEQFIDFLTSGYVLNTHEQAFIKFAWCAVPVLASSVLVSLRGTVILSGLLLVALLTTGMLSDRVSISALTPACSLLVIVATLTAAGSSARQQSALRFQSLFQATIEGIAICRNGVIVTVNAAFEEMFRVTATDAMGAPISDYVFNADIELSSEVIEGGKSRGTTGIRADDTRFDLEVTPKSGHIYQGVEVDVLAFHDITERKQAHRAIERAKERAIAAARAKSDFLASMSHEIRTPLNAVIGMNTLLLDTNLNVTQREFVTLSHQSGESLLTLVDDILDFSKIEAGQLDIETRPFALDECVGTAVDLIARAASDKNLDLSLNIEPNTPYHVIGDSARLKQVLANLLGNAVKFTERGEINLTVKVLAELGDGRPKAELAPGMECVLELAVRDTGIGISAQRIGDLFQPFRQADTSTTRKYGGTGLGLSICKQLAQLMGGDIRVDTKLGRGSTFYATIRTEVADLPAPDYARAEQPLLIDKRALVLMPSVTSRRLLIATLERWGMLVEAPELSDEGLLAITTDESAVFNVALADVSVCGFEDSANDTATSPRAEPGASGAVDALRRLAARGCVVIPLYPLGHPTSLNAGATEVTGLSKPVKLVTLYQALTGALSESVNARPAEGPGWSFEHELGTHHPLRILVAEDNPINKKLAHHLLARLGYTPDIVDNGRDAIAAFERDTYDVILMDLHMPIMDGIEATRRLRAGLPDARQPSIIALTADAFSESHKGCLAAGMNDLLLKPIELPKLVAALRACQPVIE